MHLFLRSRKVSFLCETVFTIAFFPLMADWTQLMARCEDSVFESCILSWQNSVHVRSFRLINSTVNLPEMAHNLVIGNVLLAQKENCFPTQRCRIFEWIRTATWVVWCPNRASKMWTLQSLLSVFIFLFAFGLEAPDLRFVVPRAEWGSEKNPSPIFPTSQHSPS